MSPTDDLPISVGPGWYPDPYGSGRFRWWDGGWTPHLSGPPGGDRRPPRPVRWFGLLFVLPFLFTPIVMFALLYGDPYPVSRAGVARGPQGIDVVNAICRGEQLTEIELARTPRNGTRVVIWRVTGRAPLRERIALGSTIEGFTTDVALTDRPAGGDELELAVFTTNIESPYYALSFRIADIPDSGVLSYDGVFARYEEFRAHSLHDTRCGDPTGKRGPTRIALGYAVVTAAAAIGGVAMVIVDLWSRRRHRA